MDTFSLRTFEDVVDPDVLDEAKTLLDTGFFRKVKQEEAGLWSAKFEEDDDAQDAFVEIGRGEKVLSCSCDCAEFDEEHWDEDPCPHVVALLYAAKGRRVVPYRAPVAEAPTPPAEVEVAPAVPEKRKPGRPKRVPATEETPTPAPVQTAPGRARRTVEKEKKPSPTASKPVKTKGKKDPAEQLLSELEPREIYEFVRGLLGKNKEFRSTFLLHFADKDTQNPNKYPDIIASAIASVKGRRKYLQGADGAKIATQLAPLYKQAVNAEAKGHFREAMAICSALLQQLPEVFRNMETGSARLSSVFTQSFEVMGLLVANGNTPRDLRDELFALLRDQYVRSEEMYGGGDLTDLAYKAWLNAAVHYQRLAEVGTILEGLVKKYKVVDKKPRWSEEALREMRLLGFTADFYQHTLKDNALLEDFLRRYSDKLPLLLRLAELKVEQKAWPEALKYLKEMQTNERSYSKMGWDVWNLGNILNGLFLVVYQGMNDGEAVRKLAARLFEEGNYMDFAYLELEKAYTKPEKWRNRVAEYLQAMRKSKLFSYFGIGRESTHPRYIPLLLQEGTLEEQRDAFSKLKDLTLWEKYGATFQQQHPADYVAALRDAILQELKKGQTSGAINNTIATLIYSIHQTEGGAKVAKELVDKCRRDYSNRRNLIQGIKDL